MNLLHLVLQLAPCDQRDVDLVAAPRAVVGLSTLVEHRDGALGLFECLAEGSLLKANVQLELPLVVGAAAGRKGG